MVQKGLNTWTIKQVIKESANLAKWNPNLAVDWMEDVYKQINNESELQAWTKTAQEINFIIDLKEKSDKVKHEEYWGHRLAVSRRVTIPILLNKGIK